MGLREKFFDSQLFTAFRVNCVFVSFCLFMASVIPCFGGQRKMIALLKDSSKPGYFPALKEFGVETDFYDKTKIEKEGVVTFIKDLKDTNVLDITNKSKSAWRLIVDHDSARKALREFLARGGTVFCDYKAASNGNGFLYCLGAVELPWSDSSCSSFADGIAFDKNSILGSVQEPFRGHGGWIKYIRPFKKLIVIKERPEAALLLMQENVNGKGRIIYSLLIDFLLWAKNDKMKKAREKHIKALLEIIFNDSPKQ